MSPLDFYFEKHFSLVEAEEVFVRQGPKKKSFSELGAIQKRRVTQPIIDSLKSVAEGRMIDLVQLSGYILKR